MSISKNTVTVGASVVLSAEAAELFGLDTVTIYEVCDCRLAGGRYTFTIAPISGESTVDASRARSGMLAEDLRVVGN